MLLVYVCVYVHKREIVSINYYNTRIILPLKEIMIFFKKFFTFMLKISFRGNKTYYIFFIYLRYIKICDIIFVYITYTVK